MPGNTVEGNVPMVDLATFETRHLHAGEPVLLALLHDEQAETGQRQVLVDLLDEKRKLHIVRADQRNLGAFQDRFGLLGTPTYVLFSDGKERERMLGMTDSRTLKEFVSHALEKSRTHAL